MKLILILFLISCSNSDLKESNNESIVTTNEDAAGDKIILNSKLVIDNSEGYPTLIDVEKNYPIIYISPSSGNMSYQKTNDSTYNFTVDTRLLVLIAIR